MVFCDILCFSDGRSWYSLEPRDTIKLDILPYFLSIKEDDRLLLLFTHLSVVQLKYTAITLEDQYPLYFRDEKLVYHIFTAIDHLIHRRFHTVLSLKTILLNEKFQSKLLRLRLCIAIP